MNHSHPVHRTAFEAHRRRSATAPTSPFGVFIGYADLPAVRRAMTVIDDAIRWSGHRFELHPMLWRFDQLTSEHWRQRAIQAASEADVIVLASSAPAALTGSVEAWIDAYLQANRGRASTLVAVSGANEAWTISIELPATNRPKTWIQPAAAEASDLVIASVG